MITIKFDNELIDGNGIVSLSQDYKMFDKSFYLGATPCRAMTLEIFKDYYTGTPEKVELFDDGVIYATLHVDSVELVDKVKYKLELTDAMTLFNEKYDASPLIESGTTTLKDILDDICSKYNITCDTASFYGDDKVITWYDNQRTARDYIGYIAELNGGYAVINESGNLELKNFSNTSNNNINVAECEDFTLGEHHEIAKVVYDTGVLKYEAGSDNAIETAESGDTVYINPDNVYITGQNDIDSIYNKIDGFEFYSFEITNSPNISAKIGENLNIIDGDNIYKSITEISKTLNGNWVGGYSLNIDTEKRQETQIIDTETKVRNISSKLNRDEAQLEIVAQQATSIQDSLNNNYYNINQVNSLILNAESGITNTFSEAGGNNIFRNTGLWFENTDNDSSVNPYEFWEGNVSRGTNEQSSCGYSLVLQNDTLSQEQEVPNGNYSVSFWYKVVNPLATGTVKINDITYNLTSTDWKQFYTGEKDENDDYVVNPLVVSSRHIKLEFTCSIDNAIEIYDIMVSKGTTKLAWSQNQNETTTSTVNISKGITITSSDNENVKFKADYDGIRILDKQDDIKTKFTDKGMETNEAIITDEAQICKVLIIDVGDQTWFTRM